MKHITAERGVEKEERRSRKEEVGRPDDANPCYSVTNLKTVGSDIATPFVSVSVLTFV